MTDGCVGLFRSSPLKRWRRKSEKANDDFARTVPPDRNEVGAARGDDEGGAAGGAADKVIRIEKRAGEKTPPCVKADRLAAMKVTGKDELVTLVTRGFPDAGIVGAEDVEIGYGGWSGRGGSGDGEGAGAVSEESGGVLDPAGTGGFDGGADLFLTGCNVVISRDGEDGGDGEELLYQVAEVREFGKLVDEIAAEEDEMGIGTACSGNDLRDKVRGPAAAEVDVADVGDAAG